MRSDHSRLEDQSASKLKTFTNTLGFLNRGLIRPGICHRHFTLALLLRQQHIVNLRPFFNRLIK
jgi:hypothetical protein